MTESQNKVDIEKLCEVIHKICSIKDIAGRTVLAKILWFTDTDYFNKKSSSVTSAYEYPKYEHGPLLKELYDAIDILVEQGKIEKKTKKTFKGEVEVYRSKSKYERKLLNPDEIKFIEENTKVYGEYNARQISEFSHEDWWDFFQQKEPIPISIRSIEKSLPITEEQRKLLK